MTVSQNFQIDNIQKKIWKAVRRKKMFVLRLFAFM